MGKFDIYRKGLSLLLVAGLILLNFRQVNSQSKQAETKIEFNQKLADELKAMAEIDQIAAYIPQGKYKQWPTEKWDNFKDSVFKKTKSQFHAKTAPIIIG